MSVKVATPTKDDIFRTVNKDMQPNVLPLRSSKTNRGNASKAISMMDVGSRKISRNMNKTDSPNIPLTKKRRCLDKSGSGSKPQRKRGFRYDKPKHSKDVIELPTRFLLGGNITDPLNLNSMNDERVNKLLNAETPVSSPLPTPAHRKQVEVLIPPNISDPLNLNSGEEIDFSAMRKSSAKKRKKHKRKKSGTDGICVDGSFISDSSKDFRKPLSVDIGECTKRPIEHLSLTTKLKRVVDKIVSPAIPQHSPKPKRKRANSECLNRKAESDGVSEPKHPRKEDGHRIKKQTSQLCIKQQPEKLACRQRDDKFIYGNYDRYYGKRNPQHEEDKRLDYFPKLWFKDKDVLDIGCNIGHITLSIAKDFKPRKVVGMDIDGKLINVARKNVKHYLSRNEMSEKTVPVSLPLTYGPLVAASFPAKDTRPVFPDNIHFVQGNYLLERDSLLELQKEEYDVILALSITKWLHLNFGDDGLKRCFRRMYMQLRPGGKLILEPQSFASYKKKKKLTETIFENYNAIELKPERFNKYLLSSHVGFVKCDRIETPFNKSQGFQRPIFVYTKPANIDTTHNATDGVGVTPLMNIDCSYTPAWDSYATPSIDCLRTPASDYYATPMDDGRNSDCSGTPRVTGPSYSAAHTPVYTTVTEATQSVATESTCVTSTQDTSVTTTTSVTDSHSSVHVDSEQFRAAVSSSAKESLGNETPNCDHVVSSSCDATCSQTSSSSCDTCSSDCSYTSCRSSPTDQ